MNFRYPATVLVLCSALFLSLSPGQTQEYKPFITREYLRLAIYGGDIDTVEYTMRLRQEKFLTGELNSDNMRWTFSDFTKTDPRVYAFVDDWLQAYPNSPYAHIARAWNYFTAGWAVRGTRFANRTHADAFAQHYFLHAKASEHARRAYQLAPKLVPASDALLRLANTADIGIDHEVLIKRIMRDTPNYGSVYRALNNTHTGYGGTSARAWDICDTYAPLVPSADEITVIGCKIDAAIEYHWKTHRDWATSKLNTLEDDRLLGQRRWAAAYGHYVKPDARKILAEYFDLEDTINVKFAEQYDQRWGNLPNVALATPKVLERARAHARKELQYDPYNHWLIGLLERRFQKVKSDKNGETSEFLPDAPTRAERAGYLRRKLGAVDVHLSSIKVAASEMKAVKL